MRDGKMRLKSYGYKKWHLTFGKYCKKVEYDESLRKVIYDSLVSGH